jgi:hypothetical protein
MFIRAWIWRKSRRWELGLAVGLAQGNAPEMLALAQEFTVGQFWYGRRGQQGAAYYELMNLLGDKNRSPRSLERDRPPKTWGSAGVGYLPMGEGGVALQLSYQGRQVLLIPPETRLHPRQLAISPGARKAVWIIPGNLARTPGALAGTRPEIIVVYGSSREAGMTVLPGGRCHFTSEGAVSLKISGKGAVVEQWRP